MAISDKGFSIIQVHLCTKMSNTKPRLNVNLELFKTREQSFIHSNIRLLEFHLTKSYRNQI